MKKILLSCLVALMLNGCATNPYTGQSEVSDTAWGAGLGTLAGAGIGALVGGEKGALIGAGVGAAAGAGTGYYMDAQAKKLRAELVGTGVQVMEENGRVKLIMPGNITFATDSATINSAFKPVLSSVSKVIKEYSKTLVEVSGYTDNTGSSAYNNTLSLQRANAVSNYLRINGISANRLLVNGFGSKNPIASNATAQGRAENRRVEIVLINQN